MQEIIAQPHPGWGTKAIIISEMGEIIVQPHSLGAAKAIIISEMGEIIANESPATSPLGYKSNNNQ